MEPVRAPGPPEGGVSRVPRKPVVRARSHLLVAKEVPQELLVGVDPRVDVLHNPMSLVAEQYRGLRNRIERIDHLGKVQTIAITSALKGEGKSLTAANLALVMAQDGTKSVLLVDADLRRPQVHKLLGLPKEPGLGDYLRGACGAAEVLRRTSFFGLTVATAGVVEGHPSELMASPEFEEWVASRRKDFDTIIFDTPPVHPVSDVNFLANTVDGVMVVVRANRTSKTLVKHVLESLPADKVLGLILNRADRLAPGYGYGYARGDYYYKYY